jgi:hypothetical protein
VLRRSTHSLADLEGRRGNSLPFRPQTPAKASGDYSGAKHIGVALALCFSEFLRGGERR